MPEILVADLFTFGEILALFLASDTDDVKTARTYDLSAAGAEANVAVAVNRLGLSVSFMSRVGKDELGDVVISELEEEKLLTQYVKRVDEYTCALIRNRGTTRPVNVTYLRKSSAGSTMCVDDLRESDIRNSRWVHATGITAAISLSAREAVVEALAIARSHSIKTSFDLNIRRKIWSEDQARETLFNIAQNVDVLFGGEDEYEVVFGSEKPEQNLEKAIAQGNRIAVMTAGPGLVRVLDGNSYFEITPPVVKAVDPVGSGDAFVGGTIAGLLAGISLKEAIVQGSKSGASVASQFGDWAGLPFGVKGISSLTEAITRERATS